MRNRILHLADLHLGAAVDGDLPDHAAQKLRDCRDGFLDRLADYLAQPDCPIGLVLIVGDLFDRHDPPEELETRIRRVVAASARSVPVITVPGNHDELSYRDCPYRRGDWPGVLVRNPLPEVVWHGPIEPDGYLVVVSAAYEAGKTRPGTELRFPTVRELRASHAFPEHARFVAAAHATVTDYFGGRVVEGERCFRVSHRHVADAGYDYLALGHIHRSRSWRAGSCQAVYPGPVVGPTASDPGTGTWVSVRVTPTSLIAEASPAPPMVVPTRWNVVEEHIAPEEPVPSILERIARRVTGGGDHPTIVRLQGRTSHSDLCGELRRGLADAGLSAVIREDDLEVLPEADADQLAREESLTGCFVRKWRAWVEAAKPDQSLAWAALLEGLQALGWKEGGDGP